MLSRGGGTRALRRLATPQAVVVLTSNLGAALEGDAMGNFLRDLALHPSGGMKDTLTLAAWRLDGRKSDDPLWSRILEIHKN